jgi:hypothetical protein
MNAQRLEELLIAWEENTLTAVELSELKHLLATDAQARRRLVEAGVAQCVAESRVQTWKALKPVCSVKAADSTRPSSGLSWLSWPPLTAAAAGLVLGMFCTSVVFGYSVSRVASHLLELVNAGFEQDESPLPLAAPIGHGAWGGDGRVVGALGLVSPVEGKRMVRFMSSELNVDGKMPLLADVSQAVDMRSWRDALRDGKATVNCSASFNGDTDPARTRTTYRIDVRAYTGDVSLLQKAFPERSSQEVAHSCWRTEDDHDPSKWQTVAGSIILPPETDFLLIELKVFRPGHGDAQASVESAHCVDDVRLTLTTPASSKTFGLTHSTP